MIRLQPFLTAVQQLAPQLPTGLDDPHAASKLQQEWQELQIARRARVQLGALLEIADLAYYAAKAVWNQQLDPTNAYACIAAACQQLNLTPEVALRVLQTKYTQRIANACTKDDYIERQAVVASLNLWYCFTEPEGAAAAGGDPTVWYQPHCFHYHHRPVILVDLVDPITECQIPLVPVHHLTIGYDH